MYKTVFLTGDYKDRQERANELKVTAYFEQHLNAVADPRPDYAMAIVGNNASERSRKWAREYIKQAALVVPSHTSGDLRIGGRGNGSLVYTNMPAILAEPLFCSNPVAAEFIKSPEGIYQLALAAYNSITSQFPEGLIGLSCGHLGKVSSPNDKGASVYGGGYEGDYANQILVVLARMLQEGL